MTDRKRDWRQEVALFRHNLISEILAAPPGEVGAQVDAVSERSHVIPGSKRTRVAPGTLRDWMRRYRESGFTGLHPRRRSDHAQPRRMSPETIETLLSIKRAAPHLSVRQVIIAARSEGGVPEEEPLPPSTIYRLFAREAKDAPQGAPQDRRRFAYAFPGELWMADVLHGPRIGTGQGRKSYLIALIDDATRVIPYAEFAFSENTADLLSVLREALQRRGIPQRLYVDNGSSYRSRHLAIVCANLGIALIHARPYQPSGKGKIERWMRTVRSQLLSTLEPADTASLEALNRRFRAWVEGQYHEAPHRGLDGMTPLDKWAALAGAVRYPEPTLDLEDLFLFEEERRVHKDRTVSLHNVRYEVPAELIGCKVILRPSAPSGRPLKVMYNGKPAGEATLLDVHVNARLGRSGLKFRDRT